MIFDLGNGKTEGVLRIVQVRTGLIFGNHHGKWKELLVCGAVLNVKENSDVQ